MIQVPLTRGKFALIDDDDAVRVAQFSWAADPPTKVRKCWYASARIVVDGKITTIRMHRLIMNAQPGEQIDHWNGDGLDNRRGNLRKCTGSQNRQNIRELYSSNKSGYKGVHWCKSHSKWVARVVVDGKVHHLGYFSTREEAGAAYDAAAKQTFGEFAATNSEMKQGTTRERI